jgi:hypothetical protein
MLIVALVLAVIGLAALVTAVVTSNELIAWVCIGASVIGVLLLIVDAVRERSRDAADDTDDDTADDTDGADAADAEESTAAAEPVEPAEDYPEESAEVTETVAVPGDQPAASDDVIAEPTKTD